MSGLTDTSGKPLPAIEAPSAAKLRTYGDFLFLAFRSDWHRQMSVANLRSAFEAPIELDQYRVFRFDDVPRAVITWAWLNSDAERRYVRGGLLEPDDWRAGDRLWLLDIIAPYRGLTASISRWIMVPGQLPSHRFRFRRVGEDHATRRIVSVDLDNTDRKARILSEKAFLAEGE